MVGGYDYFGTHDYRQTNLAKGVGRQTGSAFKPVVLATAIANGVPLSKRFNAPGSEVHRLPGGVVWSVKGGGIGSGTMEDCTVASSNTCYANIILDPAVGPQRAIDMAAKLGITSTKLIPNYAAVLGTNNATVQDMASAYGTFADDGVHVPPTYVTRIERADGTLLYEHKHTQTKVLEPEVARAVSSILPGVIERGTGTSANIGRPAGGKTGSSQNNVDGWFCGYTPQLSTAVWVGFAQARPDRAGVRHPVSMQPPTTRITVFGGTYPAQIWADYMKQALARQPVLPLIDPSSAPVATTTVPPSNAALLGPMQKPAQGEMPDVSGMEITKALERVRSAGLEPQRLDATVAGIGPGLVVGQSPSAGTKLLAGTTVYLEAIPGTHVPSDVIPDVRGFGARQATDKLTALGFSVTAEAVSVPAGALRPDGKAYEAGQVWRTTPAVGSRSPDGKVVVTYATASGSPPSTTTAPAAPTTAPRAPAPRD
jgi:penicillin-binding protein 1A